MRFLLELMACYGSCSSTSSMVKEEARLLVSSVPRPPPPSSSSETCRVFSGRKRGRGVMGSSSSSGVAWRPSLSSISEDNVVVQHHERNLKHEHHHHHQAEVAVVRSPSSSSERNLKRKISSTPRPRPREDVRRQEVHAVMPTFSPAPFMF
ncbi:hypothetical protein ACH5RR_037812 [Cinchona calisaya]|uniref:Uncharacterized protein n=1 Tax=Cinchona calisaya TaxID=153742 RepID=A0ABD2Y8K9_9GENT